MKAKEHLIVALDFSTLDEAKKMVEKLEDKISIYKVGLELFLTSKGEAVDYLHGLGKKVFLDLKFHDIPNTTKMASKFAIDTDVFMFNVHAGGGKVMMKEVASLARKNQLAIAVTILTSFEESQIQELFGTKDSIKDIARKWAKNTQESGMDGVVCSPWEAASIKELCGEDFKTITPGVRPAWAATNDQKRIMTPSKALQNGCDFLVVGRPITKAENPAEAAQKVLDEMEEVL